MHPSYFPLRWESTGDQWWYASPIDWAAANGLYDLVSELLHLDTNLLIKLTSLRRIRRLETVWDDESHFSDVAKSRSYVARKLLKECETQKGHNSLIRAGYGGWLLYTAASAGDMGFIKELLERDPLLVFGEGEYGITDMLYAAARSKNSEVFRVLIDFSALPGDGGGGADGFDGKNGKKDSVFKLEMMNRAVHAAARGGNLEILKESVGDDVLGYRDVQGSTVLHSASAKGQIEVVKDLVASYDIIDATDNQGNTALHVAAYRGYLPVVEFLIRKSPSLACVTNKYGDTFLHMTVSGFRTPGFRRVDRQIELTKQLIESKIVNIQDIINIKNDNGKTALHMAVMDNIQSNVVELFMTVPYIDLNARDASGMTPLDLLKQRPKSASSEILIKRLVSAGGISNFKDDTTRDAIAFHLKGQSMCRSPGTSFKIPDAEIFLYTGIENGVGSDVGSDIESVGDSSCLSEVSEYSSYYRGGECKGSPLHYAAGRLKFLLRWAKKKERKSVTLDSVDIGRDDDPTWEHRRHVSLRQIYSKSASINKTSFSFRRSDLPSPSTRMKFSEGLMHGVIQATPRVFVDSPSSPFSRSSASSPVSLEKQNYEDSPGHASNVKTWSQSKKRGNKKLMNRYFCFGAQGLAVEASGNRRPPPSRSFKRVMSLVS